MIKHDNVNFVASKYAPNPKEAVYWIDLAADSKGSIIKSYNGSKWVAIVDKNQTLTDLDKKADKATTLAGYGIKDAYTKFDADQNSTKIAKEEVSKLVGGAPEQLDTLKELATALGNDKDFANKVTSELSKKVESQQVKRIEVVEEIPENQEVGVLYVRI